MGTKAGLRDCISQFRNYYSRLAHITAIQPQFCHASMQTWVSRDTDLIIVKEASQQALVVVVVVVVAVYSSKS